MNSTTIIVVVIAGIAAFYLAQTLLEKGVSSVVHFVFRNVFHRRSQATGDEFTRHPLVFRSQALRDSVENALNQHAAGARPSNFRYSLYLDVIADMSDGAHVFVYKFGNDNKSGFTAELEIKDARNGTAGALTIAEWTTDRGTIQHVKVMNQLRGMVESAVRNVDSTAEFSVVNAA